MIPILIAVKNKLFNCINFIKNNFQTIAVIIIMILTAFLFIQNDKLKTVNQRLDSVQNNYEYYMNKSSNVEDQNRILQLTIDDYKETKDSLINEIKTTQKKLKIKEKELYQTQIQKQEIKHDTTVIVKSPNFTLEIKPNSLTSIIINKQDSLLTHKLDIKNSQTLFVTNKRIYKNKYKNWFVRLLNFDFKKKNDIRYQIHNSNDLIEITDSRMIELK